MSRNGPRSVGTKIISTGPCDEDGLPFIWPLRFDATSSEVIRVSEVDILQFLERVEVDRIVYFCMSMNENY